MSSAIEPVDLPAGWLCARRSGTDDLGLVVVLLNSYDPLADPADRLTTVAWLAGALVAAGAPEIADALVPDDVPHLRRLRDRLRRVFASATAAEAAQILNPLLVSARAISQLVIDPQGSARLDVAPHAQGRTALAARLPAALARLIAEHGLNRLGTCEAHPCTCVYIDTTHSPSRRYCCDLCNDRVAAAAYRSRRRNDRRLT